MNLRDFKKEVEYFIGEFVDDCTLFIAINPHKSTDKMIDVQNAAIDLYNDMKDKANAKVEKKDRKNWFAGLRKEMYEKLDALYEQLSAIVSEKDGEE
ncbi:MAG: hypothetical protein MR793_06800 [Bacteroidales bacterium]|nr:hypothetical protein [Bacteroidales bacterium]MDY5782103.1 hypothetical protein [Candidatus Cryptobacteroides sp.]